MSSRDMARYAAMRPYFEVVAEALNGLVDGADFFDMHASDVVVEYKPAPEAHDLVWARQAVLTSDDRKVTNLKVRRVTRNTTPTSTGPTDTAHP